MSDVLIVLSDKRLTFDDIHKSTPITVEGAEGQPLPSSMAAEARLVIQIRSNLRGGKRTWRGPGAIVHKDNLGVAAEVEVVER